MIYQAESGSFDPTTSIQKTAAGFTGAGYVNMGGRASYLTIPNIMRAQQGDAALSVRYATPSGDRPCHLIVNGIDVAILPFKSSGGETKYTTSPVVTVKLRTGANTIRFVASSDQGGPNIDIVEVKDLAPNAPAPANPPVVVTPLPVIIPPATGGIAAKDRTADNTGCLKIPVNNTAIAPDIKTDGQVIENLSISESGGKIDVTLPKGAKAYIRNLIFDGGFTGNVNHGSEWAINALKNLGTVYVDHITIRNCKSDGFIGHGIVMTNSHIYNCGGDGGKPIDNCQIGTPGNGNLIEDIGFEREDAHADGLQGVGMDNTTIEDNKIVAIAGTRNGKTYKGNTAIMAHQKSNKVGIRGNVLVCTHTGIHGYPEGGSMAVTGNDITAEVPLALEDGVLNTNNTLHVVKA